MKKYISIILILIMIFFVGFEKDIKALIAKEGDSLSDGGETYFHYKYIETDGNPAAYCLNRNQGTPVGKGELTLLNEDDNTYSDEQKRHFSAIIAEANKIKKESIPQSFTPANTLTNYQYFVAELAINVYLGLASAGSVSNTTIARVNTIKDTPLLPVPDNIIISSKSNENQKLEVNKDDIVGGYIKSKPIIFELNHDIEFKVEADKEIKVVDKLNKDKNTFSNKEEFYLLIPVDKIPANDEKTITYKITAEKTYSQYKPAKIYKSVTPNVQNLAVYAGTETLTKNFEKSFSLTVDFDTYATVKKVDKNTNRAITGVKLQLLDSNQREMSCELSDSNSIGKSSSDCSWITTDKAKYILNLDEGTYYLKEISSLNGYTVKTNLQRVNVTKGSAVAVVLTNEKNKITFSKKDATGKAELPGATLEIQDKDGNTLHKWISTSTPKVIEGMAPGKYYFVETIAPDGYVLSKEKVEFEITATTATQTVTMSNKLNKVVISKKDATGKNELPGATLHVLDKDKKSMSCTILKDGKEQKLDKCTWVSGTKEIEIVGLKAGKYYLKETIAPDKYVLSEEMVSFELKDDQDVTNVVMKNKLNKVVISKINAFTKKELPGATLEIQNEKGEIVKYCSDEEKNNECKWVSTEEPYEIEGLPNGTYYLVETIAPKGFVLNKEKVKFTVDGKTAISYVQMENELEVEVPDTLSSRSVLLVAISMFDIALGIGIINYVKKNKFQE